MEHTLKNEAYEEDVAENIAYYLIKDKKENILFYFSIKYGILYDLFGEEDKLRKINSLFHFLVELEKDPSSTEEDKETKSNLGFKNSNEYVTAIPLYDYVCKFMYQELKDIEKKRKNFYLEFNPDEKSI